MINLFIAGHGKNKNGTFDSGATGYISEGEHNFMVKRLFPAMKKYIPTNEQVIFHTDYNVYSYRNIVALARKYGRKISVTEFHFDSSTNANAQGGHVIIWKHYKPDLVDINLAKAIGNTVGLNKAYNHLGYSGISGRTDLYNLRQTANNNITYRLIELGFGSNKKDSEYMKNNIDTIAKELLKAYFEIEVPTPSTPSNKDTFYRVQVGAFGNRDNAIKMRNDFRKIGYSDAFIISEDKLFKVIVGSFKNKQNAIDLTKKLEKAKKKAYISKK